MKIINLNSLHKLEEIEIDANIFPPKEPDILCEEERNLKLLEDIHQKQIYEFNIELILDNSIKINSNELQEKIEQKLPIEKELIKLEIPIIKTGRLNDNILEEKNFSDEFNLTINDVLKKLESKGYPIFPFTKIYIYISFLGDYVLIDDKYSLIYSSLLSPNNFIKLKLKNVLNHELIADSFSKLKQALFPEDERRKNKSKNVTSRKRKIKEIIKLVYKYRYLNKGFCDEEGKFFRYNLEEASAILNVSPKTLNEYLKQIKYGRETNFDFNKNKDKKISFLRKHNRTNHKFYTK